MAKIGQQHLSMCANEITTLAASPILQEGDGVADIVSRRLFNTYYMPTTLLSDLRAELTTRETSLQYVPFVMAGYTINR